MTDKVKLYAVKNDEGEWLDEDRLWGPGAWAASDKDEREKVEKCYGGHVVALTEEQKVKLPREVGEELDDYQAEDIDLLDYLHDAIDSEELRVTRVWMLHDREHRIGILADAYRYGWEAEPEAKWYVKSPESWKSDGGGLNWLYKPSRGGVDMCSHTGESDEQFTRAELKKYHFDSDIFTKIKCDEND